MSFNVGNIVGGLVFEDKWSKEIKRAQKATSDFSDKADKDLGEVEDAAKQTSDGLSQLMGAFAAFEGVKMMAGAAANFAAMGAELEQTRVSMEVFLGSAQKADEVIANLNRFSAVTPFTSDQVVQAGKSLLAFGLEAEKLEDTLRSVGDVSAATGKDFNELATIYGKAMTSGVVQAEELNQLTEAGVPIIAELAKNMGVAENQVKKLGSEGKISFEDLEKAFQTLTGEGGKFFNLMEKQSKTAAGLMSTLQGAVEQVGAEISEQMLNAAKPALEAVVTATTALLDTWNSLDDDTKELIGTLIAVNGALVLLGATVIAGKLAWTAAMAAMAASNVAFMATLGPIAIAMGAVTAAVLAYKAAQIASRSETEKTIESYRKSEKALDGVGSSIEKLARMNKESAEYAALHADTMSTLITEAERYGVQVDDTNLSLKEMRDLQRQIREEARLALEMEASQIEGALADEFNRLAESAPKFRELQRLMINDQAKFTAELRKGVDAQLAGMDVVERTAYETNVTSSAQHKLLRISEDYLRVKRELAQTPAPRVEDPPSGSPGTAQFNKEMKESTSLMSEFSTAAADAQKNLQESVSGMNTEMQDFQELMKEIAADPMAKGIEGIGLAFDMGTDAAAGMGEAASKALSDIADGYMDMLNAMTEATQAKIGRNAEIVGMLGEIESERMKKRHETELEELESKFDAEIAMYREAAMEKKILADEELAEKKRRLQEELNAELEKERILFEREKEMLKERSADKQQARLAEQVMENDWANYVERRRAELNEKLLNEESQTGEEKQKIESEVNAKIESLQEQKEKETESLRQRQEKEEKEHTKKMAAIKYAFELFAYESQKRAAIAAAGMKYATTIMSAVQAGANMAAIFPPITAPLGAALTAGLIAMATQAYNASITTINLQKPLPPPSLFMQEGGVVQGKLHSQGGTNAELEAGEMVVSRSLTTRVEKMVERDESNLRGANINISEGAIVVQGNMDPGMVDLLAEKFGQMIQQRRV